MKVKILDHGAWTFDPETGEPLAQIDNHIGPFNSKRIPLPVQEIETDKPNPDCGCNK